MSGTARHDSSTPVVLTGATGFIGRHVQQVLLGAGYAVRALVRPGSANRTHADPRCEVIETELVPGPAMRRALADSAAIVYCAGTVRGRTLGDFLPANVEGVRRITRAAADLEPGPPVLMISSLAASRPGLSHYARSKYLGEQAVQQHATRGWTILRPPAVYGPGDREMLPLLRMARSGWIASPGPRGQRVSLLYATDLARAVLAWLRTWPAANGGTYAIDDGRPDGYDWPAIAVAAGRRRARVLHLPAAALSAVGACNLLVSGLFGYAPMLTPGKVRELTQPDWLCDNEPFTAATGWRPTTDLARGLRLTLDEPSEIP